ncbi:MAG TPA: hypothetical protein VFO16_08785 [Pseudonocardiaceae bacterium]|nr:hypothetical protein [Pseudonocardiaceae bacterium]
MRLVPVTSEVRSGEPGAVVVLVCGDAELARWPLPGSRRPSLALADQLARLHLHARRQGCSIRLRGASAELVELLELVGLAEILRVDGLETGGQAERREQRGVKEVVMPDDPVP